MKILLTGGGTGGHFYPLIAVANALNAVADQEKIAKMELVFMAESQYNSNTLLQNGIRFKKTYSGKLRRYFSLLNITDMIKIIPGVIRAVFSIYFDFPDVVFSKGGHESFPVLIAARFLGIPVIIHESDAAPGKTNLWSSKFAKRIAISFPDSASFFKSEKVALTGNPVRKELFVRQTSGAKEYFNFESNLPTILVMGGSQGARVINDNILDIVPELIKNFQIIHQCGKANYEDTKNRSAFLLESSPYKSRYRLYDYMDFDTLRMAYGAADLAVSRAGAGSIFELGASGLPSILIPLQNAAQDHQRENAYAYAKTGAADVIEEINLKPHILKSEIEMILSSKEKIKNMAMAAKKFTKPDTGERIAREIIKVAIEHK